MTTDAAIALYRAEKEKAVARGVSLTHPQPIPERTMSRAPVLNHTGGATWLRPDAFIVHRPKT